jgi:membrane-bound lytic murein transglycosylase B
MRLHGIVFMLIIVPALCASMAFAAEVTAPPASAPATPTAPQALDVSRADIKNFIAEQIKAGADEARLTALLAKAVSQPKIIETMSKPAEKALQWYEYRARFLSDERINAGVNLWREHRELLERVARSEKVAPQYVVAILGVETFYGRITGRYRVIDALATLAFDYPPRSGYFRSELAQFLKLCEEEKLDPLQPLGSYAGAMGVAQFMPSSYRQYAVNEDGTAARDLWRDWGDIFASVAHYLHQYGWEYGGSVLTTARLAGTEPAPEPPTTVNLSDTLGSLQARGFATDYGAAPDTPAVLVAAPTAEGPAWRIGFKNFYVITRYNRSPLYAMAVNDLADAIYQRFYR